MTVAGMVAVITAVLSGSAGGLLAAVVSGHSLVAALVAGVVVTAAALTGLMRYQNSVWIRGKRGIAVPRRTITPTLNPPGQSARCAGLRHSWVAHGGRR